MGSDEVNEDGDGRDQDDGQEHDKVELIPIEVEVSGNSAVGLEGGGEQVGQVNDNVNVGEVQVQ